MLSMEMDAVDITNIITAHTLIAPWKKNTQTHSADPAQRQRRWMVPSCRCDGVFLQVRWCFLQVQGHLSSSENLAVSFHTLI